MKTITDHKALGFTNLTISNVPETAEEFDTQAGRTGACLEDAVDNVKYRGWNSEFRRKFAVELLTQSKFERAVVKQGPPKKDGSTSPILESEADYVKRYVAAKVTSGETKETVMTQLGTLAQSVAKGIAFDPKTSTRASGPGKEWEAAATSALATLGNNPDRVKGLVSKLESLNPGLEIEVDEHGVPSTESLAKALKQNAARQTAELTA